MLVTGATGYIGGSLAPHLVEAGYPVRVMVRNPDRLKGKWWAERVEVAVPAEVVRVAQASSESDDHPRGVAVRFGEMNGRDRHSLEVYVARAPKRRPA